VDSRPLSFTKYRSILSMRCLTLMCPNFKKNSVLVRSSEGTEQNTGGTGALRDEKETATTRWFARVCCPDL